MSIYSHSRPDTVVCVRSRDEIEGVVRQAEATEDSEYSQGLLNMYLWLVSLSDDRPDIS